MLNPGACKFFFGALMHEQRCVPCACLGGEALVDTLVDESRERVPRLRTYVALDVLSETGARLRGTTERIHPSEADVNGLSRRLYLG